MTRDSTFEVFVNLLALTYHEARNVRHLVREGFVDPDRYARLTSLPTNKFKAWEELSPLRDEALARGDVDAALKLFGSRFDVTLADLETLYRHEGWRNATIGGNAWVEIARRLGELAGALQSADAAGAASLVETILAMRHNTGVIDEKLDTLDARTQHG